MAKTMIVYGKAAQDNLIENIKKRFSELDMEIDVHPKFSFDTIAGYLPVALRIKNSGNNKNISCDTVYTTGFELYNDEFDFEADFMPKKQPGVMGLLKKVKPAPEFIISPEIDAALKKCSRVYTFNFSEENSLELRAACIFSGVLCELLDGISNNPISKKWRTANGIVAAMKEIVANGENNIDKWRLKEFSDW